MSRSTHLPALAHWSMPGTVALLIVLSIAPPGLLGWVGWFGSLAVTIEAPISHPLTSMGASLSPASTVGPTDPRLLELKAELDDTRVRYLQAREEIQRLRTLNDQLSQGALLNPDVPVRQLPRSRIATTNSLLVVRAGSHDGVTVGTVVTTLGVQLVGRVVEVGRLESRVMPITLRGSNPIEGIVMLEPDGSLTRRCLLEPVGDGTLRGDVEEGPDTGLPRIQLEPGQTVRLSDDQWPRHAQMLTIGLIERVEADPDRGLRQVITVRPIADPARASRLTLRIPIEPEAAP